MLILVPSTDANRRFQAGALLWGRQHDRESVEFWCWCVQSSWPHWLHPEFCSGLYASTTPTKFDEPVLATIFENVWYGNPFPLIRIFDFLHLTSMIGTMPLWSSSSLQFFRYVLSPVTKRTKYSRMACHPRSSGSKTSQIQSCRQGPST